MQTPLERKGYSQHRAIARRLTDERLSNRLRAIANDIVDDIPMTEYDVECILEASTRLELRS